MEYEKLRYNTQINWSEWWWDVEPGYRSRYGYNMKTTGQVGMSWKLEAAYMTIEWGEDIIKEIFYLIIYDFHEGEESILERWENI